LLLDEPLSNLDAQLRKSTRTELKRLQRQLGITAIYVTHDQEEALALSDRMAVMHQGVLQHVGAPQEIYNAPENLFVMNFIGSSNVLPGRIMAKEAGQLAIMGEGWQLRLPSQSGHGRMIAQPGLSVNIAFRPEHARVTRGPVSQMTRNDEIVMPGLWQSAEFAGTHWLIYVLISNTRCSVRMAIADTPGALGANGEALPAGESVLLHIPVKNVMLFDKNS
jgi:iron(III) transport system ATP-binding protein